MWTTMIELGGNIKLHGFSGVDPPTLIIVKKIVGNYAKRISEESRPFEELSVMLDEKGEEKKFGLKASLVLGGKTIAADVLEDNLFFALDNALSRVFGEVKKK